jgi:uncharacterized membrane protein
LHVRDVSKTYDRKFSEIGSSVVNILIFLLGSLLNIPIAMQDTIIHLTTTTIVGYTALMHMQLFFIYPLLAAVPTLFFAVVFHFVSQTGKATANLRHQKLNSMVEKKRLSSGEDPIIAKVLSQLSANQHSGASLHTKRRMSLIKGVNLLKSMTEQNQEELDDIDSFNTGRSINSADISISSNDEEESSTICSELIQPSIVSSEFIQPSILSSSLITVSQGSPKSLLSYSTSDVSYL